MCLVSKITSLTGTELSDLPTVCLIDGSPGFNNLRFKMISLLFTRLTLNKLIKSNRNTFQLYFEDGLD